MKSSNLHENRPSSAFSNSQLTKSTDEKSEGTAAISSNPKLKPPAHPYPQTRYDHGFPLEPPTPQPKPLKILTSSNELDNVKQLYSKFLAEKVMSDQKSMAEAAASINLNKANDGSSDSGGDNKNNQKSKRPNLPYPIMVPSDKSGGVILLPNKYKARVSSATNSGHNNNKNSNDNDNDNKQNTNHGSNLLGKGENSLQSPKFSSSFTSIPSSSSVRNALETNINHSHSVSHIPSSPSALNPQAADKSSKGRKIGVSTNSKSGLALNQSSSDANPSSVNSNTNIDANASIRNNGGLKDSGTFRKMSNDFEACDPLTKAKSQQADTKRQQQFQKQQGLITRQSFLASKLLSSYTAVVPQVNVLVVEDNIINMRILERYLRQRNIRSDWAENGRKAIEKWRKGGFHLVLMDIQMPELSGLEATKEIRRLEQVNRIGVFSNDDQDEGKDTKEVEKEKGKANAEESVPLASSWSSQSSLSPLSPLPPISSMPPPLTSLSLHSSSNSLPLSSISSPSLSLSSSLSSPLSSLSTPLSLPESLSELSSEGILGTEKKADHLAPSPVSSIKTTSSTSSASKKSTQSHTREIPKEDLLDTNIFKFPVIIVALTASSRIADKTEALAAGCNDYLVKPVDLKWLWRKTIEWGCMQALIDFEGWKDWVSKSVAKSGVTESAGGGGVSTPGATAANTTVAAPPIVGTNNPSVGVGSSAGLGASPVFNNNTNRGQLGIKNAGDGSIPVGNVFDGPKSQ